MTASPASKETRLPRAVQRISEDVKAKLADREAQRLAALNPDPDPSQSPASTPPVDPPPPSQPPAPAAATPPPAPASSWRGTTPPQDDPRFNDPAYWRQRFSVTEGRIAAIERERKAEREATQTRVAELQEEVRKLKASAPAAPIDLTAVFTPEEIEKYGEEQCRILAAKSTDIAKKAISEELEARVKPIEDARANEVKAREADRQQAFRDQVTALYPGWMEADKDPRWLAWLAAEDPASSIVRQDLLNAHIARNSARGVASMFQAWEDSTRPPPPPAPPMVPHGQGASGDGSATPGPSQEEIRGLRYPTAAETKDFFKRAALNKVTPEERVTFEKRMRLPNPNAVQVRPGAR